MNRQLTPKDVYLKAQKEYGLKIGDKVKVTHRAVSWSQGWGVGWVHDMDLAIGKIGFIEEFHNDGGYKVVFFDHNGNFIAPISGWNFPYFVLKKVE